MAHISPTAFMAMPDLLLDHTMLLQPPSLVAKIPSALLSTFAKTTQRPPSVIFPYQHNEQSKPTTHFNFENTIPATPCSPKSHTYPAFQVNSGELTNTTSYFSNPQIFPSITDNHQEVPALGIQQIFPFTTSANTTAQSSITDAGLNSSTAPHYAERTMPPSFEKQAIQQSSNISSVFAPSTTPSSVSCIASDRASPKRPERRLNARNPSMARKSKHKCDVCNRCYSRKDNLRAHYRIHSGVKPYKCTHCKTSFRWLGTLRKHQNISCTLKVKHPTNVNGTSIVDSVGDENSEGRGTRSVMPLKSVLAKPVTQQKGAKDETPIDVTKMFSDDLSESSTAVEDFSEFASEIERSLPSAPIFERDIVELTTLPIEPRNDQYVGGGEGLYADKSFDWQEFESLKPGTSVGETHPLLNLFFSELASNGLGKILA